MPPRYAYWTILIGDEPTAFRSGSQEELMPTLKRLQQRHAGARMMWWQNGKLWNSRLDAQEAMRARGEMGRRGDERQTRGGYSDRQGTTRSGGGRPSTRSGRGEQPVRSEKLEWKPKGEGAARPRRTGRTPTAPAKSPASRETPAWKPKGSFSPERSAKPGWKPKSFGPPPNRDWKPKPDRKVRGPALGGAKPAWTPKTQVPSGRPAGKLEWQPKGRNSGEKRQWVPKEEYKKSQGIEAKRDKNWRPGGEHKDPRQKYKDAKKAKWGRFKQTIRRRWESKTGKKNDK